MSDDNFGFLDAEVPKTYTPPAGYEDVHQDGMSWPRQGQRRDDTSWISVRQWAHMIAQFRALRVAPAIDMSDVPGTSPFLLSEFVARRIVAILANMDDVGYGLMPKADYDPDDDGIIGLAEGGTGVAATDEADLRDKLGISAAIAAAVAALVASSPSALDTLNELAAALGDDANFAATMTAALAAKLAADGSNLGSNRLSLLGKLGIPLCQFVLGKVGSNLKLSPSNGNLVTDGNGAVYTIPAGGITLAPTGATPSTAYNIFGYDGNGDGEWDTLEMSATGVTVAANGVPHKTGAPARRWVGTAVADTGPTWADGDQKRWVRSAANEPPVRLYAGLASNTSIGNSTFSKISGNLDCSVLLFEGERILASIAGTMWGSGGSPTSAVGIGIDTSTSPQASVEETPTAASHSMAVAATAVSDALTAGLHTITGCGRTGGTTMIASYTVVYGEVLRRG